MTPDCGLVIKIQTYLVGVNGTTNNSKILCLPTLMLIRHLKKEH